MSRNWDEDDWDRPARPRRGWEDDLYDDLPTYRSEPSGAVTSVAVASFIWGGLFLLISGCFGFCFLVAVGPRGGPPAAGILGGQESILGIRFLGFFSWAVGVLVAGIGLVMRRAWGRVLALVLAAFAGLGGVGTIGEGIYEFMQTPNIPGLDHGMFVMGFFFAMVIGLLLVIYAIWAFIVLLSSKNTEEFR